MGFNKGDWVEIENTLLKAEERAASLPDDTKKQDFTVRISGFLNADAEPGEQAEITSLIGRVHSGTLRAEAPEYTHSFGPSVPELLHIGWED